MIHHFHSSLDCRGVKYAVIIEGLKKNTDVRYLWLLCGGSNKDVSHLLCSLCRNAGGLGQLGRPGRRWFLKGTVVVVMFQQWLQPGKWQWALCMLSESVYRASLLQITSDIWSEGLEWAPYFKHPPCQPIGLQWCCRFYRYLFPVNYLQLRYYCKGGRESGVCY